MVPVNLGVLPRTIFGSDIPESENWRTHYGKLLDLNKIDFALRQAEAGLMREMTDISRETNELDGHLSSLLQKRMNRLLALPWEVRAAKGDGINGSKAEALAKYVRDQLDQIPSFVGRLIQLNWGVFDGRAGSEIAWRRGDADWRVTNLSWIHPRRICFGANRDLRVIEADKQGQGFRDVGFPLQHPDLPYKFITYTPQLFADYPEREGLAPRCLYWSRFGRYAVAERNMLLELFGRPWRVVNPIQGATTGVNNESLKTAYDNARRLSAQSVGVMPPGFTLDVIQPFSGAGQVASDVLSDSQKVLSKLILGNTGTTDAVSTGLGSSIGDAHLSEEDLIIASDAIRISEIIEDQLTDAIVAVNFGPDALTHAPKFVIKTEGRLSTEEESARLKGALDIGLRVAEAQAREKLGIREIEDDEPYLIRVQRPTTFGQAPVAAAPEIVYPLDGAPPPGELAPAPETGFNLPAGGDGPPPDATPPAGGLLPEPEVPLLPAAASDTADVDEPDAIAALCEQMNEHGILKCPHGRSNRCPICGIEVERQATGVDAEGNGIFETVWKPMKKPALATAAAKEAWMRLLASARPNLSRYDLELIEAAPLEEIRLIVGTTEHPP